MLGWRNDFFVQACFHCGKSVWMLIWALSFQVGGRAILFLVMTRRCVFWSCVKIAKAVVKISAARKEKKNCQFILFSTKSQRQAKLYRQRSILMMKMSWLFRRKLCWKQKFSASGTSVVFNNKNKALMRGVKRLGANANLELPGVFVRTKIIIYCVIEARAYISAHQRLIESDP